MTQPMHGDGLMKPKGPVSESENWESLYLSSATNHLVTLGGHLTLRDSLSSLAWVQDEVQLSLLYSVS